MKLNTKNKRADYHNIANKQHEIWQDGYCNNIYRKAFTNENIMCAYDILKRNKGSKTAGIDKLTIDNLKTIRVNELINTVKNMVKNYKPKAVRRVYIPKANGKMRPLGIPSIWDRLIQQCIKQIIEPICENKFENNSYGFRPKRSQEHALAEVIKNVNLAGHKYLVNVDIKGFFDNVNHSILMNQLWSIGIKDRKLLMIIKKMLKAQIIEPDGTIINPDKGTPQGGILSPLLSNVVLNDLDKWVNDQWRTCGVKIFNNYGGNITETTLRAKQNNLKKNSKMKVGFLIRYADDFVITCKTRNEAERWQFAVRNFLKRRLKLETESNKSTIVNLRRNYSEFLGFKIKVRQKTNGKWIARTSISDKKKAKIIEEYREMIKNTWTYENARDLNLKTIGLWNYYQMGTDISLDMKEIVSKLNKAIYNHFSVNCEYRKMTKREKESTTVGLRLKRFKNDCKIWFCDGMPIMPISMGKTVYPLLVPKNLEPYTETIINENKEWIVYLQAEEYSQTHTSEFNINRISRYAQQKGKCAITKEFLGHSYDCHHKIPKYLGGNDEYENLIVVSRKIHNLIHMIYENKIKETIEILKLDDKQLKKINLLRSKCKLDLINI